MRVISYPIPNWEMNIRVYLGMWTATISCYVLTHKITSSSCVLPKYGYGVYGSKSARYASVGGKVCSKQKFYPNFVTISTGEIERKFTSRNMTGRTGPWGLQQFSPASAASVGQPPHRVRWDFTRAISAPKDHRNIGISQTSSKWLSMDWFKGKFTGNHRFSH